MLVGGWDPGLQEPLRSEGALHVVVGDECTCIWDLRGQGFSTRVCSRATGLLLATQDTFTCKPYHVLKRRVEGFELSDQLLARRLILLGADCVPHIGSLELLRGLENCKKIFGSIRGMR